MKNKFIALALITLSVATTTVSCTKDDLNPTKPENAVKTASADLTIQTDEAQNATAKSVNRGDLHAWISSVHINATSQELSYSANEDFTLVDDGTGESNYRMNNIAIGKNTFTISTTCSTPQIKLGSVSSNTVTTMMDGAKGKSPYAVYGRTVTDVNILSSNGNSQSSPNATNVIPSALLTTQNGRAIAVFQLSQMLKDLTSQNPALGVYAVVTPTVDGVAQTSITVTELNNGQFYWSDANSTNGKVVSFKVELRKVVDGTLFNPTSEMNASITIVASKSVNRTYTINENDLTSNSVSQTFTAQPWDAGTNENVDLEGNPLN